MSEIKVGDQVQVSMKTPRKEYFGKVGTVTRIIDGYQCKLELENGEWIWEHIDYLLKLLPKRESNKNTTGGVKLTTCLKWYKKGLVEGFKMAKRIYEEEE